MKTNSIVDYLGCIVFELCAPIIRVLPKRFSLFLGKKAGELLYYFDLKHKAIAYSNIKAAFGTKLSPHRLKYITKEFYRTFGQNIIEIFFIPKVDKGYLNKYISFEGLDYIEQGFKRGRGVILLSVHAGSWELSNIICANLGFLFVLFARDQRYPRLGKLLNSYRSQKGCKIIQRKGGIRQLIQAIKNNEAIGMTADQGGKAGIQVKFFGKQASMPSGAVRLALKHGTAVLPVFYTRVNGPYIKTIVEPPFNLKRTGNLKEDIRDNLQELVGIFEKYIKKYPWEYLWSYKIWKYSIQKSILILNDGKVGHLRQSQFLAKTIEDCLEKRGIAAQTHTIEVRFKNKFSRWALLLSSGLSGRYHCQGCLWCLRNFLTVESYESLTALKPDYIVSSSSSLAAINYILARENLGKSIVNMRPSILNTNRFDLVIMPRHDVPPKRKNIVVTEGALNVINPDYLREEAKNFSSAFNLASQLPGNCIGLLIGGDAKNFRLDEHAVLEVIKQVKSVSERLRADILVTTSRRTPKEVENLVKEEFKNYPRCKALIIANEKNIPSAIGGILGLSRLVVVSAESISMVSEAVASERYVLVFKSGGVDKRHKRFLNYFLKHKYIKLDEPNGIGSAIEEIWQVSAQSNTLKDNSLIRKAIERLI